MRNLTLEEFKKIHEDWQSSGLTIRDYCNNNSFDEGKFFYWRKRLRESMLPQPGGFIPVKMMGRDGKIHMSGCGRQTAADADAQCEIVYANGVTLKVKSSLSLEMLRSLIQLCQ